MKNYELEHIVIAARPKTYAADERFTDRVMAIINNSEIFSAQIRNTNVINKETFMTKLKHLPKFAVLAIAIGGLLILSGTAFAAYQLLWTKPSVELDQLTTSSSGREEVVLSTKECGTSSSQEYELKKGATITADQIPAIVQAQCELKAIDTWAQSVYGRQTIAPPDNAESYIHSSASVSMARRLAANQSGALTFAANEKYGQTAQTFTTSSDVVFIVDGRVAKASEIKVNDVVAYVVINKMRLHKTSDGGYSGGGMPDQTLVAVVKLTMPFEDYDQLAWQSLSERQACYGNPDEKCIDGASIDLYIGNTVGVPDGTIMKQIQGVVTVIGGNTISLQATSGTVYRIVTPTDVIADYNDNRASQHYNNQRVVIGSSLSVNYTEPENEHSTTINASYVRFMMEIVSKGDPIKAY